MDIKKIKSHFPQVVQNPDDIYLDSASTTLKLDIAIQRVMQFYQKETSNVHRGVHHLSSQATLLYEKARSQMAQFLSAKSDQEIVFTKSTTEGINFLAHTLSSQLKEDDEILLTEMEHHSNFLPWKIVAKKHRLKIRFIPVTPEGELDLSTLPHLLNSKTKIVSFIHQSNSLGTVNPAQTIIQKAKITGAITIVDAAQSISTMNINVQKLNSDFLVFSGHKLFSPSGVGVIYGKQSKWDQLEPYQTGGGMVVDSIKEIWANPPHRFEAGTPPIEGVLALAESIEFLQNHLPFSEIQKHEQSLLKQAETSLIQIPKLRIIGTSPSKINTLSFVIDGLHSDDVGNVIGMQKVAIRSGHHCCQPLMEKYQLPSGTIRASFSIYNEEKDIICLEKSVKKAIDVLS